MLNNESPQSDRVSSCTEIKFPHPGEQVLLLNPNSSLLMSDSGDSPGTESSILGKRARNDNTNQGNAADDIEPAAKKLTVDDDSDDDDVGPMPMPADAPGTTKKKRKGR